MEIAQKDFHFWSCGLSTFDGIVLVVFSFHSYPILSYPILAIESETIYAHKAMYLNVENILSLD